MGTTSNRFASHVLFELETIRYTHAPIQLTEETRSFIEQMAETVSTDGQTLTDFLMGLPLDTLRDNMIGRLMSRESLAILARHNELAKQKEDAVANSQFELAVQKRDEQQAVLRELQAMIPNPIEIRTTDVVELVRDLGFDGRLSVDE